MSLYTFINGEKKYIVKPLNNKVTLTVNPTYSETIVTFDTPGDVSGNTITVNKGTTVSYTLSADRHETITYSELVDENKIVTPQIQLSKISPVVNYTTGTTYQITRWIDRGQCIQSGTYSFGRGNQKNTWNITTDTKGSIISYTTSGSVSSTITGNNVIIAPTGGWIFIDIWE